ncbi:unnamed protein product [marine sediment metagenome]|uniref:Uncharacterized protein n=1 Tax=marine sediment metagenome TaxID=412755 RepID=X1KXJ8_9ZZZZ
MPHILEQYYVAPAPEIHGSISLTLTNTVYSPGDPTFDIHATLTIYDPNPTSEPQIEVSLIHE